MDQYCEDDHLYVFIHGKKGAKKKEIIIYDDRIKNTSKNEKEKSNNNDQRNIQFYRHEYKNSKEKNLNHIHKIM